jgi:hypothetical protein
MDNTHEVKKFVLTAPSMNGQNSRGEEICVNCTCNEWIESI